VLKRQDGTREKSKIERKAQLTTAVRTRQMPLETNQQRRQKLLKLRVRVR